MWSFGYTDQFCEDGPIDVIWGEASTFVEAIAELLENVEKEASDADSSLFDHFEQVIANIRIVADDPAYVDPDLCEDLDFTDEIGEINYYVTFVN